jgi:hypothetical protein
LNLDVLDPNGRVQFESKSPFGRASRAPAPGLFMHCSTEPEELQNVASPAPPLLSHFLPRNSKRLLATVLHCFSGGAGGSSKAPNNRRSKRGGGGKGHGGSSSSGQGSRPPAGTTQQQPAAGRSSSRLPGGALGPVSTTRGLAPSRCGQGVLVHPWRPSRCPLTSRRSTRHSSRRSSRRLLPTTSPLPMVLDSGLLRGTTTP